MNNNAPRLRPVTFEDARLIWKNFSGVEKQFNEAGNRNFHLILDEATYQAMKADGWNVKRKEPREEGADPLFHVEVAVSFRPGTRPPKCVLVTGDKQTVLGQHIDGTIHADEINIFDMVAIKKIDLIINPYYWEANGNSGIKAYLKTIYVHQELDELEAKYIQEAEDQPQYDGPRFE